MRFDVGSVAGVEIRIDRSWLLIALLVTWTLWGRFATDERGTALSLAMAVAGALLVFGSVLAHELAHALEARHRGVEVSGITLFLFGGATETSFDVEGPRVESALAAVGPVTSLVLGAVFGLVATYAARAGVPAVPELAGNLGWINVALALFHLLPGAPLDGGRVLRAAVWAVTDDRARAIRVASRAGQVMGWLIAGLGLFRLFLVPGAFVDGIWLLFIGWFLAGTATSEIVQRQLQDALGDTRVGQLVWHSSLPTIGRDSNLSTAADALKQHFADALAVTDGERMVGMLHMDDVADVPMQDRADRRVGDHATPVEDLPSVSADESVGDALPHLSRGRAIAVVDDDGEVVGVLTSDQVQQLARRTLRLGHAPSGGAGQRASRERADESSHIPAGEG